MARTFLSARWEKLIMANYPVEPAVLQPFVPYGTELDFFGDTTYASLVGFMFKDTRVLGVKIPFHVNFEEVNLRFYVRYKDGNTWKRGTVFIKEIVPKFAISWVANTLYGEHYQTMPMRHTWDISPDRQHIKYEWKFRGVWQALSVEAGLIPQPIAAGSEEEFITEHYWGYTQRGPKKTSTYEVRHPRWNSFPIHRYQIDFQPGKLYGSAFANLSSTLPTSVLMADGSDVKVLRGQTVS